ncbi:MAG: Flp pilus assembly protein ATPase CpaF [Bacteriovoracaceae bacterium]|nr:Flp pilus assembly protein ATPase CpaF [Bacteriovoracaceae bacterium]
MAAEPRSLSFPSQQMWVCFRSEAEIKFAPLTDRCTVGSASSNAISIDGRGVRSLHGQFFIENGEFCFRDFQDKNIFRFISNKEVSIGIWKASVKDFEALRKEYEKSILDSFKAILKEVKSENLVEAYQSLRRRWFLTKELPEEIRKLLKSQVAEISLSSPIEKLLEDPEITDILVESYDRIWIERSGELLPSGLRFINPDTYEIYLENLLSGLHKTIDEVRPFLDFVLTDGSRAHLIVPPLTDGARYLSIRKIKKDFFTLEDLHQRTMFSEDTLKILRKSILDGCNILISGATGSGKTTLLKALLNEIPKSKRIVVIEDTSELRIPRENAAFLYSRMDLRGSLPPVTLRDLVRQALRMRPDRIMIGEVRGEEALDLMHAMNTGHRGCMGSLHANSARDALFRLQGLIQMSSASLSESAMRDLIARNLHLVLHCGRDLAGSRKLLEYAFVRGLDQSQILMEVKKI